MELENRKVLQHLWNHGTKKAKDLHQLTNIPLSTCYDIIKRLKSGEGVERKSGSGGGKKLKGKDMQRIAQLARFHPKWTCSEISRVANERGSPFVHQETIRRNLAAIGYIKWVPKNVPMLTTIQKQKRVEWCRNHLDYDWSKVIITDESVFQLFTNYLKVWGKKQPKKMVPKKGPSIMIWGGISVRGKTPLKFVDGIVNAEKYQQILEECLIESMNTLYPDGWVLQQDNAPPHTARSTKKFFEDKKIEILEWPACSPDLSPIENCWGLMKRRVEKMNLRRIDEWKGKILNVWDDITQETLKNYFQSLPSRLQICIDAEGATIKK